MYKGVIFDIDGTLYDYQINDFRAMNHFCAFIEENLGIEEKKFRETYTEARRIIKNRLKDTAASHSRILLIQTALELLNLNPFEHVLKLYNVYWDYFLDNMRPYDGLIEFLSELKAHGIKISTCTDMTAQIQYRKLKILGLDRYFDFMVTSEETGFEKPAPIMFKMALEKLKIHADEALYFGDALDKDILGAKSVGIEPIWFIADRNPIGGDNFIKIRSYRDETLKKLIFGG